MCEYKWTAWLTAYTLYVSIYNIHITRSAFRVNHHSLTPNRPVNSNETMRVDELELDWNERNHRLSSHATVFSAFVSNILWRPVRHYCTMHLCTIRVHSLTIYDASFNLPYSIGSNRAAVCECVVLVSWFFFLVSSSVRMMLWGFFFVKNWKRLFSYTAYILHIFERALYTLA